MHTRFKLILAVLCATLVFAQNPSRADEAVRTARYRVLPGEGGAPPNFLRVLFTTGPGGRWQVDVHEKDDDGVPMMQLRGLTSPHPLAIIDPLAETSPPLAFADYQLRILPTGEAYDYRDANNPAIPLVPTWGGFDQWYIPRPARGTASKDGFPQTCTYLGHVLSLREVRDSEWSDWDDVKVLELDRDLWIATSRTFKDAEERRLEDTSTNYTYVPWTKENYQQLIDAGMNVFALTPGIEKWLRAQPVFYRRGVKGDEPFRWPTDAYRTNMIGPVLYMDEPSCRMTGNEHFYNHSMYFTDFVAALVSRVRAEAHEKSHALERELRSAGVRLGQMRFIQTDYVTWDTRQSTAYYQFEGGAPGFVHEGRYQLDEFNAFVRATTGLEREHTAEEMFRYIYALMRGPARSFGRDWGTAIYGQADPALNPLAVTIAYDMGARHVWYWTSDHGHHLPWPEQLELSRILTKQAADNPRPPRNPYHPRPRDWQPPEGSFWETRDKLITVPYGYLTVIESPTNRKQAWDLWWVRELDPDKKNEASQRYRTLMRNLFQEVHKCFDKGEDFDITIEGTTPVTGYRDVVHVTDK